jgi:hypothetical protein
MFPDETAGLPAAWDYYGEVLEPGEWPDVDAPGAAGGCSLCSPLLPEALLLVVPGACWWCGGSMAARAAPQGASTAQAPL